MIVEALVDKELSPRNGAVGIQSLFAYAMNFGAEIKRRVRIDQQQCMTILSPRGCYRKTIRALWFFGLHGFVDLHLGCSLVLVECFQLRDCDVGEIAADTSFTEKQRIPCMEFMEKFRIGILMCQQEIIHAVSESVHELSHL